MNKKIKYLSVIICIIFIIPSISQLSLGENRSLNSIFQEEDIERLINEVNESRLDYFFTNLLQFGVRYTGTTNCYNAGEWIYNEFIKMGIHTKFHHWKYNEFESRNIIATINGTDQSNNAVFIISAHYDTYENSPGANDDGSGIVTLLTIAEILSNYSFNHTIKFIAFSGEEVGAYGSYFYAKEAYENKENIFAVLNVDIIGFAETSLGGKTIRFFSEEQSKWISDYARDVSIKYNDLIDISVEILPNYPGSDHQSFVDYGYEAVWIAQRDSNVVGHSPNDTYEHINITYHKKVTKLMLATIVELSILNIPIQVILRYPLEGKGYVNNNTFIDLTFPNYFYQRLRGITIAIGRPMAIAEVICKEDIEYVVFSINDVFTKWDSEPPYTWEIQGKFYPLIGRHKLKVSAYSETGEYDTDEMEIIFFTFSYQYGKFS